MRTQHKVQAIQQKARSLGRQWALPHGEYPTDVVDLIIFHKLHIDMPLGNALRSFRNLKSSFVDWNEVRVSSVREIQETLVGAPESLPLAVFIKDLLELVHRQQQVVSLEFLVDHNLTEIRRYLKQVRGLDHSTVSLILRVRKEHPVLPLTRAMEGVLDRIGLLTKAETRDKRERALHDLVEPGKALVFHHFLLNHSQECCPPDEENVDCRHCCMRHLCAFYSESTLRRKKRASSKRSRSSARVVSKSANRATRVRARGGAVG